MTKNEISNINLLRSKGWGYKRIATELGISPNNVKSYIKRHPDIESFEPRCENCGEILTITDPTKGKRFCSDACRMLWWKQHPDLMRHNRLYPHICEQCGASFSTPRKGTRFCNRKCYADFRRKENL